MPIKNPHDKLFKQTFSLVSQVTVFLEEFLSRDLLSRLNLKTLKQENVSFITGSLQEYFSDIIYSCRFNSGKKTRIVFLLEHKSYADANLNLQLLRYLTEAYDNQLHKQKQNKIDVHIPIVIYHGEEKWKKKMLVDLFDLPDDSFKAFVPAFDYQVVDLRTVADRFLDKLERGYLIRSAFLLFKYKNDKKYLLQNLQKIFIFEKREISEHDRKLFAASLLHYINAIFKFSKKEAMTFDDMIEEAMEDQAYLPGSMIDQVITARRELKEGLAKAKADNEIAAAAAAEKAEITAKKRAEKIAKKTVEKAVEKAAKEATEKTILLSSTNSLLNLFKGAPTWSDIKCAEISNSTVENTKVLRKIVKENTQIKAEELILKAFFAKIKLSDEEKKKLEKSIAKFYSKK